MKVNTSVEFGRVIKDKRKALGYTQGYVSEVTGLSASFISNLENGKATAELDKAIQLANVLGLSVFIESRS